MECAYDEFFDTDFVGDEFFNTDFVGDEFFDTDFIGDEFFIIFESLSLYRLLCLSSSSCNSTVLKVLIIVASANTI